MQTKRFSIHPFRKAMKVVQSGHSKSLEGRTTNAFRFFLSFSHLLMMLARYFSCRYLPISIFFRFKQKAFFLMIVESLQTFNYGKWFIERVWIIICLVPFLLIFFICYILLFSDFWRNLKWYLNQNQYFYSDDLT